MKILYPYNENLPRKKAHDVFIFQECAAFSSVGLEVTLLCGKNSLSDETLFKHYETNAFGIKRLPILRKNTFLNISWNAPFFFFCQKEIEKTRPSYVFLSVLKSGIYHLNRKIKNVSYIYEVHELQYYGNGPFSFDAQKEKEMLEKADCVTVTTEALKQVLLQPPYSLRNPIVVVPLAVNAKPLPPPPQSPFTLAYVGQLYEGQGISFLLEGISHTPTISLKIIGGKEEEIEKYKKECQKLHIEKQVEFLGFCPPNTLYEHVKNSHAFVAPFEAKGRMPYVAHTKLCEYIEWGRPMLAPNLPVVKENFPEEKGVVFFETGDLSSFIAGLKTLEREHVRLQQEITTLSGHFSWEKRAHRYLEILVP